MNSKLKIFLAMEDDVKICRMEFAPDKSEALIQTAVELEDNRLRGKELKILFSLCLFFVTAKRLGRSASTLEGRGGSAAASLANLIYNKASQINFSCFADPLGGQSLLCQILAVSLSKQVAVSLKHEFLRSEDIAIYVDNVECHSRSELYDLESILLDKIYSNSDRIPSFASRNKPCRQNYLN